MKVWRSLWLMAAAMLIMSGSAAAAPKSFSDVGKTHWAKSSIDYLTDREIILGYEDGRFGVNDPITRAQAATMIMRYFGWGDLSGQEDPGYPDLKPNHWAYNEIAALYHMDIFKPKGNYQPNLAVTRAEMADMLVKTFSVDSITAVQFTDLTRDHWAYQSINKLAGKGISNGYPDGTFRPDAKVTRAEFASLMTKLMKEEYTTIRPGFEGAIYDLEVGGQVYQLKQPLLLKHHWLAPVELFEKMGYYLESHADHELTITTTDGREIHLEEGQQEIWVGDTSVQVDYPLEKINGSYYIEVREILEALEKPLVFYPEQFLLRLEAPSVTVADINRMLPEAAIDVIHTKQPYWHWSKRDRDYLELLRREGAAVHKQKLLEEMELLTNAYLAVEKEKRVIRGANYYSDSVTGKLDAISRGLEARYKLLYGSGTYVYPAVGTSGALGAFTNSRYEFDYIVADYLFDHYEDNKQALIRELTNNTNLPVEHFRGLNIHGIPFFIREIAADGTTQSWAGLASGSQDMLVVNSGVGTFVHEFGHNWDSKFGDTEAYLKLRGREGYTANSSDWADRVGENFAEDFVAAFLSGANGNIHKAAFGQPTDAQIADIRQFVEERTPAEVSDAVNVVAINGATLLPTVMYSSDGKIHVQIESDYIRSGTMTNKSTGEETTIDFTGYGRAFEQDVQLPKPGIYQVTIGSEQWIVVYE